MSLLTKTFTLLIFVLLISSDELTWHTDFDAAKDIAKAEHKKMLVYFTGSDWCMPCVQLKKDLFDTEDFKSISQNYVLVYIDVPRNKDLLSDFQKRQNKQLMEELNKKKVFPYFKVLKPNGKPVDELSGYGMNGDVSYHLQFLRKHQ